MIEHIQTKEQFEEAIKGELVLVDFFAEWCGPCQMLAPIIEQLDSEMNIHIIKIDVDEVPEIARELRVMAIPTLMLFSSGKLLKRETSYMPIEHLRRFVSKI